MRAKWLIVIGLSVFLAAPFAVAQEAEGDEAQKQIQKQEKKQDQQKTQEQKQLKKQLKKQEKLQAQEQNRNRHRHRKGKGDAQGDMNAGGGSGDAEGSSEGSEPTVNPADDTQLVDGNGDGIDDKVQSQNKGEKGDGEKGAKKRGQHRYRHRKAVGNAAQQGEGTQKRAGKGFGGGFVDADGNGVCDNHPKGKK